MVGHLLVDGIAGLALIGIAFVIRRFLADAPYGAVAFYSALAAAVVSLAQFVVGETFTYRAAHGGSATSVRDMFVTLNDLDTVKIVFLPG